MSSNNNIDQYKELCKKTKAHYFHGGPLIGCFLAHHREIRLVIILRLLQTEWVHELPDEN
jgi:hypothetical protein